MIKSWQLDRWIEAALEEDIPYEDLATEAIFTDQTATVDLIAKEDGVICGLPVFKRVFTYLDPEVTFTDFTDEGDEVSRGDRLLTLQGSVRTLLSGERVALNFLQRLSGIATATHRFVQALEGSGIKLLDTRKTTPGYRALEKYAVRVGGGYNHRFSLSDLILLKDNHIQAASGVKEAVQKARAYAPYVRLVEVEVENQDMVEEAVAAGADIIMLDNMSHDDMARAIAYIDGRAVIEGSGNLTLENVADYRDLKLDYISSGSITHSAGILDLSMKNLTLTD